MHFVSRAVTANMPLPKTQSENAAIPEMQAEIARLHLLVQTLAHLLIAKGVVQNDELDMWLEYVDKLDGRLDGKSAPIRAPMMCKSCNRANPSRSATCQWCGEPLPRSFVDTQGGAPEKTEG